MNWLALILGLLPKAIVGTEAVATDVKGGQKKQAVTDALNAIASGIAQVAPAEAQAASDAAAVAIASIDGVCAVLQDAGVLKPHTTVPAAAAASALTASSVVAGVAAQVAAANTSTSQTAGVTVPVVTAQAATSDVQTGPGLHNTVAA